MAGFLTVIKDIADERSRQTDKWGQQNHKDGTGPHELWFDDYTFGTTAYYLRERCQKGDPDTWEKILSEEIFEAYAEDNPVKLREELVQSAAVIVAWIQAIDRRVDQ